MATFEQFGLKEELLKAVSALGFTTPSPIQAETIPLLINETTDITALAQTGTGKTAAFGLPLLHQLDYSNADGIQALVLSPTRELCMQIQEELEKYGKFLPSFDSVAVYGGAPIATQIRNLKRSPQVLVATPGRLIDLLDRGIVDLSVLKTVILDEADEMLNMGFRDDIDFVLKNSPERQQTWLFSATMNNDVRKIAKRYMKSPKEIAVAKENVTNENIDHQYFVTNAHQRYDVLKRLLDFAPDIYGIIFTRTKQDAQDISEKLMREGYAVSPLHGDMDQKMRTKVMERFKRKSLQAIVATDVAARGIDVNDITHVINYELPDDIEIYTHRSGRTARAGKSGICMSIVTTREIGKIRQIERIANSRFHKRDIPDGAEVVRKKLFHYLEQIEAAEPIHNFGELYQKSIFDKLQHLEKDELINRLIWLQLKEAIVEYENAPDLNIALKSSPSSRDEGRTKGGYTRLFINLGTKDGINPGKLVHFVADSIDIDPKLIDRVTVRELSSFFNVPDNAVEYVMQNISQQKFKSRKVRVEEADKKPAFKDRGNNNFKRGDGDFNKKPYKRQEGSRSDSPKFNRARKPNNRY